METYTQTQMVPRTRSAVNSSVANQGFTIDLSPFKETVYTFAVRSIQRASVSDFLMKSWKVKAESRKMRLLRFYCISVPVVKHVSTHTSLPKCIRSICLWPLSLCLVRAGSLMVSLIVALIIHHQRVNVLPPSNDTV